jgi:HK97 gp10 family phage protein
MAVSGVDDMKKKLRAMPAKVRAEGRAAMEKGAEEIVTMAKRLAPVEYGHLRDSIGWNWSDKEGSVQTNLSVPTGNDRIVIYAGDDRAFYAPFLEFGTVKMRKRSFFFPAYRALKKRTKDRITRATRKALKDVAASGATATVVAEAETPDSEAA